MSDPLADLKRRAYGRPVSEADAATAQAELRRLSTPDAPPPAPVLPEPVASVRPKQKLLLAVAALAAAALATGIALAPRPSLDVFAMPQSGVPAWPGARAADDDIRWLGSLGPWDVFGFMTAGGNVCVTAFLAGASGGGSCTSRANFAAAGLAFATSVSGEDLTVAWGPRGAAVLDGGPR